MSDRPEDNRPQEEKEPYTPASPVKRILAWVGIVYMVCLIFLNLYPFFHQGAYLTGVAPGHCRAAGHRGLDPAPAR